MCPLPMDSHIIIVMLIRPSNESIMCIYPFPSVVQLLQRDPAERLGCMEDREPIRSHPFFKDIDFVKLEDKKLRAPFRPTVVCYNSSTVDPQHLLYHAGYNYT